MCCDQSPCCPEQQRSCPRSSREGKGLEFPASLLHISPEPVCSLLHPRWHWHQHTKTSIHKHQAEKRQHSAPSSLRVDGVLITPAAFPLTKIMPPAHTERYGVCVHLLVSHSAHLPQTQTPRWRGASAAGISQALCDSQMEQVQPGSSLLSSNWPTASPQQMKRVGDRCQWSLQAQRDGRDKCS